VSPSAPAGVGGESAFPELRERRYLLLHVPKTAGSALRAIVKQNLRDAAAIENPLLSTQIYTSEQIDWLFSSYPYRFYAGHVFRLRPALTAVAGQLKLIAFVRDPVDKAISSYYYLRNRSMTRSDHPVKRHSLVELCAAAQRGGATSGNGFDDSQLDWLVGQQDAPLDLVESAVHSRRLWLFPVCSFDLAMVLLERLCPEDFPDCAYARKVNASTYPEHRDVAAERAAAATLPWVAADRELYQLGRETLASLAGQVLGSRSRQDQALMAFSDRCRERAQWDLHSRRRRSLWTRIKAAHRAWNGA
jgi:hypothetical protein